MQNRSLKVFFITIFSLFGAFCKADQTFDNLMTQCGGKITPITFLAPSFSSMTSFDINFYNYYNFVFKTSTSSKQSDVFDLIPMVPADALSNGIEVFFGPIDNDGNFICSAPGAALKNPKFYLFVFDYNQNLITSMQLFDMDKIVSTPFDSSEINISVNGIPGITSKDSITATSYPVYIKFKTPIKQTTNVLELAREVYKNINPYDGIFSLYSEVNKPIDYFYYVVYSTKLNEDIVLIDTRYSTVPGFLLSDFQAALTQYPEGIYVIFNNDYNSTAGTYTVTWQAYSLGGTSIPNIAGSSTSTYKIQPGDTFKEYMAYHLSGVTDDIMVGSPVNKSTKTYNIYSKPLDGVFSLKTNNQQYIDYFYYEVSVYQGPTTNPTFVLAVDTKNNTKGFLLSDFKKALKKYPNGIYLTFSNNFTGGTYTVNWQASSLDGTPIPNIAGTQSTQVTAGSTLQEYMAYSSPSDKGSDDIMVGLPQNKITKSYQIVPFNV